MCRTKTCLWGSRPHPSQNMARDLKFQILEVEGLFLFVWVEALCPSQQFFSRLGTFSWVEPVLSNEDKVSC